MARRVWQSESSRLAVVLSEDAKRFVFVNHDAHAGVAGSGRKLSRLDVRDQTATVVDLSDFALNRTWHNGDPSASADHLSPP